MPDGRLIHSIQFSRLLRDFDVRECQLVQKTDGQVEVLLVRGPNLTPNDLFRLKHILKENLLGISLSFSVVPAIKRNATGNVHPVISHFRTPNLQYQ